MSDQSRTCDCADHVCCRICAPAAFAERDATLPRRVFVTRPRQVKAIVRGVNGMCTDLPAGDCQCGGCDSETSTQS